MSASATIDPALATTSPIGVGKIPGGKRMRFSLGFYAVVYSCCIVTVAVGIFAVSNLNYMSELTHDELEERGRLQAGTIKTTVERDVALDGLLPVQELLAPIIAGSEELTYVVVSDREGAAVVMHADGRWSLETEAGHWREYEVAEGSSQFVISPFDQGEILHYATPIVYGDALELGWVHVGMSPHSYHENMRRFKSRTVVMVLAALAFGIPASLLFGRMITRPITRLQKFAENVAEGDLDARVETNGSKEIADLAETMNWMTERLAESKERMKNSLQQEASLREKEILLREIHHRVKNNMQILGGLIRIQCRTLQTGEARDVLMASETRIRSMALLHQKLYQSDSISEIPFGDYVGVLVGELDSLYSGNGAQITIRTHIPGDFSLGLDTALPCGLIINELVSNSFKYAFPDRPTGSIDITVAPMGDTKFSLTVRDNGIGLPSGFDVENAKSLGLRLVNMLADQLQGEVRYSGEGGSSFSMELVSSSYTART